jgi:hypothetical protein
MRGLIHWIHIFVTGLGVPLALGKLGWCKIPGLGDEPAYMACPAYVPTNVYPKTQEYTPEGSKSI